jgi:Xanthine dehydrogenase, molybdopterin-binding subunit B
MANKSYLDEPRAIIKGDAEESLKKSDHTITGEVRMGTQEHFYMETNCALAVPAEDNGMVIYCATQNPNEVQVCYKMCADKAEV